MNAGLAVDRERSIEELVSSLARVGISLSVDDGKLRAHGRLAKAGADLDEVKRRKDDVLRFLSIAAQSPAPALNPAAEPRPDKIPLSWSQRAFLFSLEDTAAKYRVAICRRIRGPLKADALEAAIEALCQRHEILRTRYHRDDGGAWQTVLGKVGVRLDVIDVSGFPYEVRATRARAIVEELWSEDRLGFEDGVNLKARLARITREDHLLYIWVNHIAADGSSVSTILREMFSLYAQALGTASAALPPVRMQYADFALREQDRASNPQVQGSHAAWRNSFLEAPPIDLNRGAGGSPRHAGGRSTFHVLNDVWFEAQAFARAAGTSPAILILTVLGGLLARWSGQDRFVLGCVANLRPPAVSGLVGCFTRVRPLRFDLAEDITFHEAMARVRSVYPKSMDPQFELSAQDFDQLKVNRTSVNILRDDSAENVNVPETGFLSSPDHLPNLEPDLFGSDGHFRLYMLPQSFSGVVISGPQTDPRERERFCADFPRMLRLAIRSPDAPLGTLLAQAGGVDLQPGL